MRVLVTGANGHIGAGVVRELSRRGHAIVGLVREGSAREGLKGVPLELAVGDVRDAAAVRRAAEGCDAIIHLAAVYALAGKDVDAIVRPAVEGVTNVVAAAKAAGCKRMVHCSSTYAVGFSTTPEPRNESHWNERLVDPYAAAKTRSEQTLWELAARHGVDVVAINPTAVLGPWDYRRTPSFDLLLSMGSGAGIRGKGGVSYSDLRDVAWAMAEALHKGAPGERYLVTGANLGLTETVRYVCSRTGARSFVAPLPRGVVVPMMYALQKVATLPLPAELIDEFFGRWPWFDSSKAARDLGFQPRPWQETIDLGLQWAVARGWLKGKYAARVTEQLGAFTPEGAG